MKRRIHFLWAALVVTTAVLASTHSLMAQTTISVASAGAGSYEAGTTFGGVSLTGMRFGIGVDLPGDGSAIGQVQLTLVGVSQEIVMDGEATTTTVDTSGTRTIFGLGTVDMGDGSPPTTGVAFFVGVDAAGPGAVTVSIGATMLPPAPVVAGMLRLCVPPSEVATDLMFLNDQDMIWTPAPPVPGLTYNIYKGAIAGIYDHVCLGPRSPMPTATDSGNPAPSTTSYYLVSGNVACGTGALGLASDLQPRPNLPPCQ